jgi:hypothetical protein
VSDVRENPGENQHGNAMIVQCGLLWYGGERKKEIELSVVYSTNLKPKRRIEQETFNINRSWFGAGF